MFTCDNVLPQGVHAEEVDGLQHSLQSQQQVGPVGQVDKPLHAFPRVVGRPGLHHPAQQNPGHVVGSPEDPPTAVQRLAGALWDMEMVVTDAGSCSNSKHWFTTSFLQPLPYLVTPYGPENCQLTSSFFVGAQTVVSFFFTNNSNKTRRVIYSRQQSLHQHKYNHNRLNRDGTLFSFFFYPGGCFSCLRACFGARLRLQSY